MKIKYFDNAATTQVNEEVLKEMLPYFSIDYGNPSSLYSIGRRAKRALEESRKKISNIIGCKPNEVYFTSCGTESDNLAIKGIAYANKEKGNHIITSKIEHPAVLNTCKELEKEGYNITYLDVDEEGFVDIEQLKNAINPKTILISIMFANNEIGTIQNIETISKIAKKHNKTVMIIYLLFIISNNRLSLFFFNLLIGFFVFFSFIAEKSLTTTN